MTLRPFAEFKSDIVDYTLEETEFDEFVAANGLVHATAIIEMLRRPDRVIDEPELVEPGGRWQFHVRTKARTFFFQVQLMYDVFLHTEDATWPRFLGRLHTPQLAEVLEELNEALQRDPRFHDIKWCAKHEIFGGGPGAPTPRG